MNNNINDEDDDLLNDAINTAINNDNEINDNNISFNNQLDNDISAAAEEKYDESEDPDEIIYRNVLDSILLIRETYIYNNEYMDIDESNVLKYIYEHLANLYSDVPLVELLQYIRNYYNIHLEEYTNIVDEFYSRMYFNARMTDRVNIGIVAYDINNNEIPNSYTNFSNISENFFNIINNHLNDVDSINEHNNFNNIVNENINNALRNALHNTLQSTLNNIVIDISDNINFGSLGNEIITITEILNNQNNQYNQYNETINEDKINDYKCSDYKHINSEEINKMNCEHCTICQENYNEDDKVLILECNHIFHPECIKPWLLKCSNLCPICRYKCN